MFKELMNVLVVPICINTVMVPVCMGKTCNMCGGNKICIWKFDSKTSKETWVWMGEWH